MNPVLAIAQMCSTNNVQANFKIVERLCFQAKELGSDLVCFPENFAFMAQNAGDVRNFAENLDGPIFSRYCALAHKNQIEISYGGFQEKSPHGRVYNAHVIVGRNGQIKAIYRKIHLFSANLGCNSSFDEAEHIDAGDALTTFKSSVGVLGLSICYDLRFGELYRALRAKGATILLVPAAFTAETGKDHWEVLLRARAIENQCYVVASAQRGAHNQARTSHGHALIVDPWGTVIAQCSDKEGIAIAEIDADYMNQVRTKMPISSHKRPDIFNELIDE